MNIRITAAAALFAFATPALAQTAIQTVTLIGQKSADMAALQKKGITGAGETADDRRWRTLAKEIRQLSAALMPTKDRPARASQAALAASDPKSGGILRRGQDEFRRDQGLPPLAAKPKTLDDFCSPASNFYARADRLDTYLYGIPDLDGAKGASISYTNDRTNGHQTANIGGFVSYVIARGICLDSQVGNRAGIVQKGDILSGYAVAPWILANGKINNFDITKEQSDLRTGVDFQYGWMSGPIFDAQYLIVSPYYQTDFRGQASGYGVTASWQPQIVDLNLGGVVGQGNDYLYWYWQFSAEVDVKNVERTGLTQLAAGQYYWFGATARAHLFLLPSVFNRRMHADGTVQGYWDATSSMTIYKYVASLAYNLTDDGNASISVEYDRGTEKDTLVLVNQYLLKLNVKF